MYYFLNFYIIIVQIMNLTNIEIVDYYNPRY